MSKFLLTVSLFTTLCINSLAQIGEVIYTDSFTIAHPVWIIRDTSTTDTLYLDSLIIQPCVYNTWDMGEFIIGDLNPERSINSSVHETRTSIKSEHIIKYSLTFLSGASDGIHETLWYHYDSFKRVHPNANDNFWNPYISSNQMNNSTLYSRTFGRAFSDGNHLTRFFDRNLLLASGIVIVLGNKTEWWRYLMDFGIGWVCRTAGFHLTYSIIYK